LFAGHGARTTRGTSAVIFGWPLALLRLLGSEQSTLAICLTADSVRWNLGDIEATWNRQDGRFMTLVDVLKGCRELAQASEDSIWSSTGVPEIVAILDRGIESLERGAELNRDELKLLFAPTGALQETSMDNGWSNEYLLLSAKFDRLI
jgi:hypothetical protein